MIKGILVALLSMFLTATGKPYVLVDDLKDSAVVCGFETGSMKEDEAKKVVVVVCGHVHKDGTVTGNTGRIVPTSMGQVDEAELRKAVHEASAEVLNAASHAGVSG